MPTRKAHLVGSLPGSTPDVAMATALRILGPHLRSLPDGETGERRNWIISIIEEMRRHPDLELRRQGDWSDYDKTPLLKVRRGRKLYGASLDFGHVAAARASFPLFQSARSAAGRPDLDFQEGVPGDFDMAIFTLGPTAALWRRRPFTEATLAEIRDVASITGRQTLFQIEVPAELVMMAKAPAPARPALARLLARAVTGLAAASPAGTRFGVHLCLGDMNNRPSGTLDDVGPLVLLTNAIVASWPSEQALELIHVPFAAADRPASEDPAFYAALRQLDLPESTQFAAGFVHESQSLSDQRSIRSRIDDLMQRQVTLASACGLGRRSEDVGVKILERTAELCQD